MRLGPVGAVPIGDVADERERAVPAPGGTRLAKRLADHPADRVNRRQITSTRHWTPGAWASRASVVRSAVALVISASATYVASYALRL